MSIFQKKNYCPHYLTHFSTFGAKDLLVSNPFFCLELLSQSVHVTGFISWWASRWLFARFFLDWQKLAMLVVNTII